MEENKPSSDVREHPVTPSIVLTTAAAGIEGAAVAVPALMAQAAIAAKPEVAPAEALFPEKDKYEAQLQRTNEALDDCIKTPFRLGDEIIKLKALYLRVWGKEMTNAVVGEQLKKRLTSQRVGNLVLTCEYFPEPVRDYSIVFKAYEVARVENEKRKRPLPVAELVAFLRDNADPEKLPEALKEEQHVFDARVLVTKTTEGWLFEVGLLFDKRERYASLEQWQNAAQRELAMRLLGGNAATIDAFKEPIREAIERVQKEQLLKQQEKATNDLPF